MQLLPLESGRMRLLARPAKGVPVGCCLGPLLPVLTLGPVPPPGKEVPQALRAYCVSKIALDTIQHRLPAFLLCAGHFFVLGGHE